MTYRIRHVDHGRDVGGVRVELFRPRLAEALLRRDPLEKSAVHDRELSRNLERVDVDKLELFEVPRNDRRRQRTRRKIADRPTSSTLHLGSQQRQVGL